MNSFVADSESAPVDRAAFVREADRRESAGQGLLTRLAASSRTWIVLAVAAAGLRLGFAVLVPEVGRLIGNEDVVTMAYSTDGYEKIAKNLLDGLGYRIYPRTAPTLQRNPGYVLLLTGVFSVFGNGRIVGQVVQALIAAGVVVLLGRLGNLVGKRAAFLAGIAYACYLPDWLASAKSAAEPLLAMLLLTMVLAADRFARRPSAASALLMGLTAGLLGLTKSVAVYVLPFMLIGLTLILPALRARLGRALVLGVLAISVNVLALLPWAYRNYKVCGQWVFTSSVLGYALFDGQYVATHRQANAEPIDLWKASRREARQVLEQAGLYPDPRDQWAFDFFDTRAECAADATLKQASVAAIAADPWSFARGCLHRAGDFWYMGRTWRISWLTLALNAPVLACALFGLVRARARPSAAFCAILLIVVYMNLVVATSFAVARYSLPVMPLVFLLAARGILGADGLESSAFPLRHTRAA